MAIANERLQKFFSNQKIGAFDALKQKGKFNIISNPISKKNHSSQNTTTINSLLEKSDSNPLAIRNQSVSKAEAIREQTVSYSLAIRNQTVSEPLADPLAKIAVDIPINTASNTINLTIYSNKERDLLNFIFWKCYEECSLTSPIITTEEIRKNLHISPERLRNLLFRISKKGELISKMFKSGQSACRIFELSKNFYQALLAINIKETTKKALPLADSLANPTYSSSYNITTTKLSEIWKKVDFEPLRDIGFSEIQLKQLQDANLNTPDVVQNSINHFAYALEKNDKYKNHKNPLNLIMGVLRKGQGWFENSYQSPQEIAQIQLLEAKKTQLEKTKKMEDEAYKLALAEWHNSLSDAEISKIAPDKKGLQDITPRHLKLSVYFRENIWPQKKSEYLVINSNTEV